ncbi:DUF4747 family protein [Cognatishimia sp.]|uniref:DUF4747 family protein n=1 Tax=Cognatishimia sp. TaxID=2211648 RepID=UPI003514DD25
MATGRRIKFSVLNVVAQPHPPGIYRSVFERAAGVGVKFWGDQYVALSPISSSRNGVFTGRIAVWTQVDKNSDVIKLDEFEQLALRDSEVSLPNNIGLNSRIFEYAFNESKHLMYVEQQNEDKKYLSPKRAELAVHRILGQLNFTDVEEVRVQIVPEADSVERVLSVPRLKRVEMRVFRPNPDELDDQANALLDELQEQGIQRTDIALAKAPGVDTIVLNARNKLLAKIAAFNGYVRSFGRTEGGKTIEASTKDHAKVVSVEADPDKSTIAQARYVAGE